MLNQAPFMLDGALLLQAGCAFGARMPIIARIMRLRRTSTANREFRAAFLNALNLREASVVPDNHGGYARIANVGFGVLHHTRAVVRDESSLHRYALLVRNLTQQVRREHDAFAGEFALRACLIAILFAMGLFRPDNSLAFDEIGIALALRVAGVPLSLVSGQKPCGPVWTTSPTTFWISRENLCAIAATCREFAGKSRRADIRTGNTSPAKVYGRS